GRDVGVEGEAHQGARRRCPGTGGRAAQTSAGAGGERGGGVVGAAVVEGAGHTRLEVLRVHLPVAPDAHGEAGGDRVGGRRADAIGAGAGGVAVEVRPRHRGAEGLDDAVDPGVGVVVDGQTAPVVDDL